MRPCSKQSDEGLPYLGSWTALAASPDRGAELRSVAGGKMALIPGAMFGCVVNCFKLFVIVVVFVRSKTTGFCAIQVQVQLAGIVVTASI